MSDGSRGPIQSSTKKDLRLAKADPIGKIQIFYADGKDYPYGYKFISRANECLLSTGSCSGKMKEIILKEGERIVGMKSRLNN